jgi:hypothetical protein
MIVAATEVSHDLTDEQMGYLPETLASFSDSIRYLYPYLKEINDLSNELNQNRQELTLRHHVTLILLLHLLHLE